MTYPAALALLFASASVCLVECASTPRAGAPRPATPAPAPAPLTPDSSASAPQRACDRVCARIADCSHHADRDCVRDCETYLAPSGGDAVYERCVAALSCDAVTESLSMNMGPLGECYARARESNDRR